MTCTRAATWTNPIRLFLLAIGIEIAAAVACWGLYELWRML
jgi:hypothetical protein